MDAPYYNGPDERESLDPEAWDRGDCASCGAGPDEPCEPLCDCAHCVRQRQRAEDTHGKDAA